MTVTNQACRRAIAGRGATADDLATELLIPRLGRRVSIEVLNESGTDADNKELSRLSRFVLDRMRVHPLAELCIKLVDEETITTLNEQWMGASGPTDVLAFPMDEIRPGLVNEEPEEGILGDLVVCPAVAARQADEAGHPISDEVDLLTVHGILHLLGYDHAEPEEHKEMFGLQEHLLAEWRAVRRGEGHPDAEHADGAGQS